MSRRVLLVDDSEADRREVRRLLAERLEIEVVEAEDVEQALQWLRDDGIELIVTELVSSDDDGLELVRRVHQECPAVPVILVTARGSEELVVQALRAGAASYVPKHLLGPYLADVAGGLLEQAESRRKRSLALRSLIDSHSTFELDNDRRLYAPLIGHVRETMAGLGMWDDGRLTQVAVALEEALVNAAEHGNLELDSSLRDDRDAYLALVEQRRSSPPWSGRRVRLEVALTREQASFVITDEGPGFDPESLPDPTDPENLLRPSGRGVLLMRALMDEVSFNRRGNQVRMLKRP